MASFLSLVRTFACAVVLAVSFPAVARAAGGKGYVSLLAGIAFPSTSSSVYTVGAALTYRLHPFLGAGVSYQRYAIGVDVRSADGSASIETSTSYYCVEGNIYFAGTLKGFLLGARTGLLYQSTMANASLSGSTLNLDSGMTRLFIAPRLSYDYYLGRFSVGGELVYYFGIGSTAPQALSFMAAGKFWF